MNATIQFTCPQCSHTMQLPAATEGRQGKCPSCAAVVRITGQPVGQLLDDEESSVPLDQHQDIATPSQTHDIQQQDSDLIENTGAHEKKQKWFHLRESSPRQKKVLLVVGVVSIIFLILSSNKGTNKTPEERRTEEIEEHFSGYDGSHNGLTEYLKRRMNDPDSYKHVETTYRDKGDYLTVTTVYRGKNGFGGVVTNTVTATVDLEGNVNDIILHSP